MPIKKRLLLIHTGGTLMMQRSQSGVLSPDVYTQDLLAELPVLRAIADVQTEVLYNLDSSDMQPEHWLALADLISVRLEHFTGVVVVHGTDTMAYTASALAFLLTDIDRPVVLTGAQKPLTAIRTDARSNLVDACHVATLPIPEVCVVFDSKAFRGCRTTKIDAWSMSAFASPSLPPLVELGLNEQVGSHILSARPKARVEHRLDPRVLCVRTFPGLDPRLLQGALSTGVRGVVIEAFGAGNIPSIERSLVPFVESARSLDTPVVIVSQCPRGAVDLSAYRGGTLAAQAGAISAADMTSEAALAKLMVVLGNVGSSEGRIEAARSAFARSWAGEVSL